VLLRTSDHSFATISDALVSIVPSQRIISVFHDQPRLGAAILWAASRDEAMTVEHLVNIGKRGAIQGMAHLILELYERVTTAIHIPRRTLALLRNAAVGRANRTGGRPSVSGLITELVEQHRRDLEKERD